MSMRHWIWLSSIGLSARTSNALIDALESPERIFESDEAELRKLQILSSGELGALLSRRSLNSADAILSECARGHVQIVTIKDTLYPDRLRNIDSPPILLYTRGNLPSIDDEVAVSVVGTRKPAQRARGIAQTLAYDLTRGGALIISGMAEGIDSAAHIGALKAGGRTIAVFGCGIDCCYPAFNNVLMEDIIKSGCVISEYAPGVRPSKITFPARNRIIAGLSLGTLVVSAPARSGSLITANLALEQGRDVYAVPGAIDDGNFEGSNELIKLGAAPVTDAGDILSEYSFRYPQLRPESSRSTKGGFLTTIKRVFAKDTEKENKILQDEKTIKSSGEDILKRLTNENDVIIVRTVLENDEQLDKIVEKTKLPTQTVLARLTMLEVDGTICQKPGKYFGLVR